MRLERRWPHGPLSRSESMMLAYTSAATALLAGVLVANVQRWAGAPIDNFIPTAVAVTAVSTPFTMALSLASWMAWASRLRYVHRESGENEAIDPFFPANLATPLGVVTSIWAILSVTIVYPLTYKGMILGGFVGVLGLTSAFVPAFGISFVYSIFAADADGDRLSKDADARDVRRFGD